MALLLCLDASVFVASCHTREPGHAPSLALLAALRQTDVPLIEPSILPVEVAAALRRAGHDAELAREFATAVLTLQHLTLVPLDARLARRAIALATEYGLRGADSLYATVAAQYGARLVTLDNEQLKRAPPVIGACTPEAAVALVE